MKNKKGRSVLTWAVMEKNGQQNVVTLSFDLWMTPEEAIEGYCKQTGKSWDQLIKEGAQLVQKSVTVHVKPDHQSPTSSDVA